MAHDEGLAERVRERLQELPGFSEKRMFGGMCYLINGNMCCGIVKDTLMIRTGTAAYAELLAHPHAREMDFTGRSLKGMLYIDPPGLAEDEDLAFWLDCCRQFVATLPPK